MSKLLGECTAKELVAGIAKVIEKHRGDVEFSNPPNRRRWGRFHANTPAYEREVAKIDKKAGIKK